MIKFFKLYEHGYASYAPYNVLVAEGEENISVAKEYIDKMVKDFMDEDPDVLAEKIIEYLEDNDIAHLIDEDSFDVYL